MTTTLTFKTSSKRVFALVDVAVSAVVGYTDSEATAVKRTLGRSTHFYAPVVAGKVTVETPDVLPLDAREIDILARTAAGTARKAFWSPRLKALRTELDAACDSSGRVIDKAAADAYYVKQNALSDAANQVWRETFKAAVAALEADPYWRAS